MTTYLVMTTILHWFMFAIWKNDRLANTFFKLTFLAGAVGGTILSLMQFGVLVAK